MVAARVEESKGQRALAVRLPTMQHSQHLQAVIVVTREANAPIAHSQAVLAGLDPSQTHDVALSGLREVCYRVDYAAPHGSIESLQVSPSTR